MIREALKHVNFGGYIRPDSSFWQNEPLNADELRYIMQLPMFDVFWQHDGNPQSPHAELTSGLCSNGFVNCRPLLERTDLCQIFARQVVRRLHCAAPASIGQGVDWVVSSSYTAIPLGKDVANLLGAKFACTQKAGEDGKQQVWNGSKIRPNERVLQIEDLNTTGGTILAVRKGVRDACGEEVEFINAIGLLVDRSDQKVVDGAELVPVAHYDIWNSDPSICPLCKDGSPRLRRS